MGGGGGGGGGFWGGVAFGVKTLSTLFLSRCSTNSIVKFILTGEPS